MIGESTSIMRVLEKCAELSCPILCSGKCLLLGHWEECGYDFNTIGSFMLHPTVSSRDCHAYSLLGGTGGVLE